jgi:non-specific serine/threonine protein kinase
MGLGKTMQVLALLLLLRKEKAGPSLLVLPASLLANWKTEIESFAPALRASYLHPSLQAEPADAAELFRQIEASDVVLTSYGMLLRMPELENVSWSLVVLDEAQAVKNPGARQTRAVKRLKARARIALTGTPVENRLSDLWSLFDFLCPGLLGSQTRFKEFAKALDKREGERYAPLRNLVRPYILRRLKTDKSVIADLPDKTVVPAYCGLTKAQAVLYKSVVDELAEDVHAQDGMKRRGLILAALMKLKQICNHPAQLRGDGRWLPEESGKFARLAEIAEEVASRQDKVLVFTQFRETTEPLAAFLATVFGRAGLVMHGQTPVKERQKLVQAFQAEGGPPFFVLSLKAGGTGLNLTAATHVIHFDRWWNPAVENQATDRAFRIGQKRNVLVHTFICRGTVEEKIDALIQAKTSLARDLLEGSGGETLLTEMGDAELLSTVALDIERARVE